MSLVRVAVPVLQGRRKFHFDKARPWSVLEHMLLFEIGKKSVTARALSEAASLPQRIIIEAVIRLMHAGWVEMTQRGSDVEFQVTAEGLVYRQYESLPTSPRRLSRNINFVVDQVTGSVFRSRDLPFIHEHVLDERAKHERIVRIERPAARLEEGVRSLIQTLFQDDERFIFIDPYGDKLAERWSLVSVRNGVPEGLSPRAPNALVAAVISAAKKAVNASGGSATVAIDPGANLTALSGYDVVARDMSLTASDLIVGGPEHEEILKGLIKKARHRVIIHSTFVDRGRFDALLPDLKRALDHGVRIDVLWGQNRDTDVRRSTMRVVTELRARVAQDGLENLHIHPFSTGSHSKILVVDEGLPDKFVALVGSCNWLYSGFKSLEVSVRLRNSPIVGDVLNELAELSRGGNGHWTDLTIELASVAAGIYSAVSAEGKSRVSVVVGNRHAELVRQARDSAKTRILVASHRLGDTAENSVLAPLLTALGAKPSLDVQIYYGEPSGSKGGADIAELVRSSAKKGAAIKSIRYPTMHAKFLVWDEDEVVITSQNWLSADTNEENPRQEIGIHVQSPGIGRLLVDKFKAKTS